MNKHAQERQQVLSTPALTILTETMFATEILKISLLKFISFGAYFLLSTFFQIQYLPPPFYWHVYVCEYVCT